MSYCRIGNESDVYVFTSSYGLDCCGCILQKTEWIDDPEYKIGSWVLGGYSKDIEPIIQHVFQSNQEMIDHLMLHRESGHKVPERAFDRLRDPKDAAENKEMWEKYRNERNSKSA